MSDHEVVSENGHGASGKDLHSLSLAYQTYMRHDEDESQHFETVCNSYRQYATFAMSQWANQQYRFHSLPETQRSVLPKALQRDTPEFHQRAKIWKDATIQNQFVLDCILRHSGVPHSQQVTTARSFVSDGQMSKTSSVLKSLARDWSQEGQVEREMAYKPLLAQLQRYVPLPDKNAKTQLPRICIPGAGVSRLALEVAKLGYCAQGNEFSLYMLLASDFILNGQIATPDRPLKIYPWLLETRNVHAPHDPCREITIPDVDPASLLYDSETGDDNSNRPDFSMAAGDFLSIYSGAGEAGKWDAVVCCFFLDACPSIVEAIQLIFHMLRPGGVLINFGPLLYHWSGPNMRPDDTSYEMYQSRFSHLDRRYMTSIDLCYEDVREVLINVGFEIVEESTGMKSLYTADRRSMMNMVYHSVNFVARKPKTASTA